MTLEPGANRYVKYIRNIRDIQVRYHGFCPPVLTDALSCALSYLECHLPLDSICARDRSMPALQACIIGDVSEQHHAFQCMLHAECHCVSTACIRMHGKPVRADVLLLPHDSLGSSHCRK